MTESGLLSREFRGERLLSSDEPPPFRVDNAEGEGIGLIVCDHASSYVPHGLQNLGLEPAPLKTHIGWDIGAADASLHISKALGMPVLLAQYSRLVVDVNRRQSTCIVEESDHTKIPGNLGLSEEQREQRLNEIYRPYHKKIEDLLDGFALRKQVPMLFFIHSFTPEMDGVKRPWDISLLWGQQEKIALQVVSGIREHHPHLRVGENQPYSLSDPALAGSTVRHAEERNLPCVLVEFRQDLINTPKKAAKWADILLEGVRPVLESPETYRRRTIKSPGNGHNS